MSYSDLLTSMQNSSFFNTKLIIFNAKLVVFNEL